MVLAEIVREEVEENLLAHAASFAPHEAEQLVNDYTTLITWLTDKSRRVVFPAWLCHYVT
jgi:hypothetical protein